MVTLVGVKLVNPAVPEIFVAPVKVGLFALCQVVTVPVLPVKVKAATVPPEHIVWSLPTVPPTEFGVTVTVVTVELADAQTPLCTTALKAVVDESAAGVKFVVALLGISVKEVKGGTVDCCQRNTVPVKPLTDNVGEGVLAQIVVPPVAVPPALNGSTVTVTAAVLTDGHEPL